MAAQLDGGFVVSQGVVGLVAQMESQVRPGIVELGNRRVRNHLLGLVVPVYRAYLRLAAYLQNLLSIIKIFYKPQTL